MLPSALSLLCSSACEGRRPLHASLYVCRLTVATARDVAVRIFAHIYIYICVALVRCAPVSDVHRRGWYVSGGESDPKEFNRPVAATH